MYTGRTSAIVVQYEALGVSNLPEGIQWPSLVFGNSVNKKFKQQRQCTKYIYDWEQPILPESIHGPNGIHHTFSLHEQRGIACRGVKISIVEEVVLVSLVTLDAL